LKKDNWIFKFFFVYLSIIKKIKVMIRVKIGLSRSKYFDNQKQVAEFLNIKNSSKKAIETRARVLSMEVEF